jgi:hypothetical protein
LVQPSPETPAKTNAVTTRGMNRYKSCDPDAAADGAGEALRGGIDFFLAAVMIPKLMVLAIYQASADQRLLPGCPVFEFSSVLLRINSGYEVGFLFVFMGPSFCILRKR